MLQRMDQLAPQVWPDTGTTNGAGRLQIGGCDLRELAERYGTPLYVLDHATVSATARAYVGAFRDAYAGKTAVHYASKALLNTAVAQLMAAQGLGLDCVSLGEVEVALRAGVAPSAVHLHGNAKPRAELARALELGVGRVVVDSLDELRLLAELTAKRTAPYPIWLRLNPGIDVHTHSHIQTGQLDSKFGLPIDTGMAHAALERLRAAPGLALVGLHAHLGSQITELDALAYGVERLVEFAATVRRDYGWTVREISPGGGLAVAYHADDPLVPVTAYATALSGAMEANCAAHDFPLPLLVVEPGRSLIARAIVAVYRVLAIKQIPGARTFAAVDGGMGDNLRPALYDARYTVRPVSGRAGRRTPITIAGRYCESGDILVKDAELPPLTAGDLVALAQAGAYTLSMASNYNLVVRPPLVLVADGEDHLLQRRETVEDLVARDRPLPHSLRSHDAASAR